MCVLSASVRDGVDMVSYCCVLVPSLGLFFFSPLFFFFFDTNVNSLFGVVKSVLSFLWYGQSGIANTCIKFGVFFEG